jgi:hypothetical protein
MLRPLRFTLSEVSRFRRSIAPRQTVLCDLCRRGSSFKEDEGTWKGNDDGKVVNNQPQRMMDDRNGLGPQGGYIGRITNDAREEEMEDNMGQVNTMIGNLRNMAIDMGSELENQNRQVDRINLKVIVALFRYYSFDIVLALDFILISFNTKSVSKSDLVTVL